MKKTYTNGKLKILKGTVEKNPRQAGQAASKSWKSPRPVLLPGPFWEPPSCTQPGRCLGRNDLAMVEIPNPGLTRKTWISEVICLPLVFRS